MKFHLSTLICLPLFAGTCQANARTVQSEVDVSDDNLVDGICHAEIGLPDVRPRAPRFRKPRLIGVTQGESFRGGAKKKRPCHRTCCVPSEAHPARPAGAWCKWSSIGKAAAARRTRSIPTRPHTPCIASLPRMGVSRNLR